MPCLGCLVIVSVELGSDFYLEQQQKLMYIHKTHHSLQQGYVHLATCFNKTAFRLTQKIQPRTQQEPISSPKPGCLFTKF